MTTQAQSPYARLLKVVANVEPHEVKAATGRDIVAVFVPNSANAAGGFLVFVPREDVTELAMSVEDALKMVVSLGVVMPAMPPPRAAAPLAPPPPSP